MAGYRYFLKSQRLGFRWWLREDLPLAFELWGDPQVSRFFGGPFSDQQLRSRLEGELERAHSQQFQYWPVHLIAGDEFVGCCGPTSRSGEFPSWAFICGQSSGGAVSPGKRRRR